MRMSVDELAISACRPGALEAIMRRGVEQRDVLVEDALQVVNFSPLAKLVEEDVLIFPNAPRLNDANGTSPVVHLPK